jgi:hypothetical protein
MSMPEFSYFEAADGNASTFDDILHRVPMHLVVSRLLAAGRLP